MGQFMHESTAVFLDRDGVINRKRPEGDYVKNWEEVEFLPGALEGLRELATTGARIIVVTNQRGIARGRMTERDLAQIHERMLRAVRQAGGRIDAFYYCPHEGGCGCRKPMPGLFERARRDFPEIDFTKSLVAGDSLSDLEPGFCLGCTTALIGSGERARMIQELAARNHIRVDICAASLLELARMPDIQRRFQESGR